MRNLHPELSCERCELNGLECRFVWGVIDSVKRMEDAMDRLVRHGHSQNRKIGRRCEENEAARNGLVKAITELSKE